MPYTSFLESFKKIQETIKEVDEKDQHKKDDFAGKSLGQVKAIMDQQYVDILNKEIEVYESMNGGKITREDLEYLRKKFLAIAPAGKAMIVMKVIDQRIDKLLMFEKLKSKHPKITFDTEVKNPCGEFELPPTIHPGYVHKKYIALGDGVYVEEGTTKAYTPGSAGQLVPAPDITIKMTKTPMGTSFVVTKKETIMVQAKGIPVASPKKKEEEPALEEPVLGRKLDL